MNALTVTPESTALLIVDVQERLLPAMPEFDRRRMVASIELLVETAKSFRLPVFVTEQYTKGLGSTVASVRGALESCDPKPLVAEKTLFNALGPPEIARGLAATGVRTVIVAGMEAHICVYQTVRELRARGYFVHVPIDAVASRDPACRATALQTFAQHGATVTSTETLVFDLLRDARHPAFKTLSAKVKDLPMPAA
jgi:nicotinamidase-related amidase